MGTTEVPANPQRVVVLDGPVLDACIALGVKPVGAVTAVGDQPFPAYLGSATEGVGNVGTISEPDLEAILALQPDLILSLLARHEDIYESLSAIAPTVLSPHFATDWREGFLLFADCLNRHDATSAVVDRFDAAVAEVSSAMAPSPAETTVSVIRVFDDIVRQYQASSFSGTVLEAIGLSRPAQQQGTGDTWTELSPERIRDVDAEYLFITLWSGATVEQLTAFTDNPLWQALPVVQAGRVYTVPDEYWMTAIGYLAADLIVADVKKYIVEGEPPATV